MGLETLATRFGGRTSLASILTLSPISDSVFWNVGNAALLRQPGEFEYFEFEEARNNHDSIGFPVHLVPYAVLHSMCLGARVGLPRCSQRNSERRSKLPGCVADP